MENKNVVTIEPIESLASKYNKPKETYFPTTNTKSITVIDNTSRAHSAGEESISAAIHRPMSRIATLEKQVAEMLERIEELEELVYKVLTGGE